MRQLCARVRCRLAGRHAQSVLLGRDGATALVCCPGCLSGRVLPVVAVRTGQPLAVELGSAVLVDSDQLDALMAERDLRDRVEQVYSAATGGW